MTLTRPRPALALLLLAAAHLGCDEPKPSPAPPPSASPSPAASAPDPLAPLRAFEATLRGATDFGKLPPWDAVAGSNPSALAPLDGGKRLVGALRGADSLVLLDDALHELQRLPAPASPTGLALSPEGALYVVGEHTGTFARYAYRGQKLVQEASIELPGVVGLRHIAAGPKGIVYASDPWDGRLFALRVAASAGKQKAEVLSERVCRGALQVVHAGNQVVANCFLDHALLILDADSKTGFAQGGGTTVRNDGPFWSLDVAALTDGLLIAAGGVEDQPLDRADGAFGFVDSFLYLYEVRDKSAELVRIKNLSEVDVVVPKALKLSVAPDGVQVQVTGYGGEHAVSLAYEGSARGALKQQVDIVPPGTVAFADLANGKTVYANALLDGWVDEAGAFVAAPGAKAEGRSPAARLGEALVFSTLMAPFAKTEGRLSKFTCETCHFEGWGDGRTHSTGRPGVQATTKPILGLANNRPHFSRALDPDLAAVSENEFDVAGRKSGRDPHFVLTVREHPWLEHLGIQSDQGPEELRKAFIAGLYGMTPSQSPRAQTHARFTDAERRGATIFRDKCEGCHEARLVSDDPASRQPFDTWEKWVLSPAGPIVWAESHYAKTGVEPYVHEEGARIPSLRRVGIKYPYFTTGSARNLEEVLRAVRVSPDGGLLHGGSGADLGGTWTPLSDEEVFLLQAFLAVL